MEEKGIFSLFSNKFKVKRFKNSGRAVEKFSKANL
jgi:hypothetical protein